MTKTSTSILSRLVLNKSVATTAAVAVLALASAGSVFAGEASDGPLTGYQPSLSRAQVLAELQQARQDGSIHVSDLAYQPAIHSVAVRAVVKAETRQAIASGEYRRLNREQANVGQARSTGRGLS